MATGTAEGGKEETKQVMSNPAAAAIGWTAKIQEQYLKIKEHAETYPYVWASYSVVYGGFGLYLAYRWRSLRNTEDRVRALQEKLRKLTAAEESAAATSVNKVPPTVDKSSR